MRMNALTDDVVYVILDHLGRPDTWTAMRCTCRDAHRVATQRAAWAPYVIPVLCWTYATGRAVVACTATDVIEVESHEPSFRYRTFALTAASVVSRPCFECVRRNRYVHIHETWIVCP